MFTFRISFQVTNSKSNMALLLVFLGWGKKVLMMLFQH